MCRLLRNATVESCGRRAAYPLWQDRDRHQLAMSPRDSGLLVSMVVKHCAGIKAARSMIAECGASLGQSLGKQGHLVHSDIVVAGLIRDALHRSILVHLGVPACTRAALAHALASL